MKKKRKRIKSFKNWLLARDSASRISPLPPDHGFFDESKKENDIENKDRNNKDPR